MSEEINNIESGDNSVVESSGNSLLSGNESGKEIISTSKEPIEDADNGSFIDSLPDEYKAFAEKKGFKDAGSALKSLENLESKFGKRFQDLTAEEITSINSKLGAPENAEGYEFNLSDDVKSDPILSGIENDFLEVGISKDKAEALMAKVTSKMELNSKSLETEYQIKSEEDIKSIKAEYGSAFDQRLELANSALRKFGGEEATKAIAEAGLANNPAIFKMLSEVGKLISEDKPVGGKEVREFGTSPAEAKQMIADLRSDPAFAERARNVRDPGHAEAMLKLDKLYKLASGKR